MLNLRFVVWMFLVGVMVLDAGVVSGQAYPIKPIRIVAPAAGGGADFMARIVAQGISGSLGQPVIVENRASGLIAGEIGANAPPDGYTLTVQGSTFWIAPLVQKTPYDMSDFSPISLLVAEVLVVAVHPSVPATSIKELIALAKAKPGELNYASPATGSANHLAAELFKSMAGVNIVRIPYKGSATVITALLSGEVQLSIMDPGLMAPHVESGKLRVLAVTSAQRSALTPGLPTVAASGLSGYEILPMTGIFAPAKTPGAIINRLNQEIVRVLNLPDVKEKLFKARYEPVGSSPEEFAARIKSDMARMGKVIKDAGIKID